MVRKWSGVTGWSPIRIAPDPNLKVCSSTRFTTLIPHRLELASQLAALEFERAVRAYAKRAATKEDLSSIIQTYAPHHAIGQWQRCRALRNRAVHGKALDQREVESLVQAVREIVDLETLKRGRTGAP